MFSHVKPLLRLQFLNPPHLTRTHNRGLSAIPLTKAPMQIYLRLYLFKGKRTLSSYHKTSYLFILPRSIGYHYKIKMKDTLKKEDENV